MKKTFQILFFLSFVAVFFAISVSPAFSGSTPKGKPFVYLNEQIVEVKGAVSTIQEQVNDLIGKVDSIEDRVGACEGAIVTLQTNNAELEAQLATYVTDLGACEDQIAELQAENASLQAQIDESAGNIEDLQGIIDANLVQILSLQATIKGLSTLQGQIDNNNILINGLQDKIDGINIALALKQNVIDGTCPEGQYLSGIVDDNLQCDTDKFYFGTLDAYYRYSYDYDYSSSCEYKYVYCPSDTQILDGKVTYTFNNYASSEYLNIYNNYYLVRMCATRNDYNAFEIRAFCGAVNNTTP